MNTCMHNLLSFSLPFFSDALQFKQTPKKWHETRTNWWWREKTKCAQKNGNEKNALNNKDKMDWTLCYGIWHYFCPLEFINI